MRWFWLGFLISLPFGFSAGFLAGAIWNGMFRRSATDADQG
jgi:hypothetical protein